MAKIETIIFTLIVRKDSGEISTVTNIQDAQLELPLLYKALRAVENDIFDSVSQMLTPPMPEKTKTGTGVVVSKTEAEPLVISEEKENGTDNM